MCAPRCNGTPSMTATAGHRRTAMQCHNQASARLSIECCSPEDAMGCIVLRRTADGVCSRGGAQLVGREH